MNSDQHSTFGVQIEEHIGHMQHGVIGIGHGGMDIVTKIQNDIDHCSILMVDISHEPLNGVDATHKLYLMCDEENQRVLTVENQETLREFTKAHQKVYLITRLDNDLNRCTIVEKIIHYLQLIKKEVILIAIKPFVFELPPERLNRLNDSLNRFKEYVDKLIVFDSEDLLVMVNTSILSISECFDFLDHTIALIINREYNTGRDKTVNISLVELFNRESK